MFNKNESSLVKLFFSEYSKSQSFRVSLIIFFPLALINKIKFLKFEKFLQTKSKTIGIGLNARDIIVPVFKLFNSKIFFWKTSVFKFNFFDTSLKKWHLW